MRARTLLRIDQHACIASLWKRLAAWLRRTRWTGGHGRPDAAALRDMGLDASEWSSIQAEWAGRAAATRRRVEVVA